MHYALASLDKKREGKMLSGGFVYCWGLRIKNLGDLIVRIPVLCLFSGLLISWGLKIKDSALKRPIREF